MIQVMPMYRICSAYDWQMPSNSSKNLWMILFNMESMGRFLYDH